MNFKQTVFRHLSNIPGWSTSRKIVVFESDDWGAIRMSSIDNYSNLKKLGLKPLDEDEDRYLSNDCLASATDLAQLFEVLSKYKDHFGRSAVFTAFSLVANPDFPRIKQSGYIEYFYEPFTETLKKYNDDHHNSFKLWKEGINKRLFVPQFHGREHLNIKTWLSALRTGNKDTINAFERGVYGITPSPKISNIKYQAAFDIEKIEDIEYLKTIIRDGLLLFESLFGYKASVFVPTNGWFNNLLEEELYKNGILYIGVSKIQHEPQGNMKFKTKFHYLGQKNKFGQTYLTRNCFFEPSSNLKSDWVSSCLKEIDIAFRWRKPAIISTHRVNYIGCLNPQNRDKGLKELDKLLFEIIKHWPDIQFMTSKELGDIITKRKQTIC